LGGQETQQLAVVEDNYPSWSPRGDQITFYSNRPGDFFQIFVMNRDGTDLRQLTFTKAHNRTPVFSPDGTRIAFQSERDGNREIYVMDADGGNQRRITHKDGEDSHPKWSANSTAIIFDSNRDHPESGFTNLYLMAADGSGVERLTEHEETDSYASLSPDGTRVLFRRVLPTGGDMYGGRNSEVFIMNRNGSDVRNLTTDSHFDGYPAWSSDGAWILIASNRDGETYDEFNLYVMRPDGTELRRLTERIPGTLQARPMFSPDGREIAFNRDHPDGRAEIHIMEFRR